MAHPGPSEITLAIEWRVVLMTDAIVLVEFTFPWGTRLVGYFDECDGEEWKRPCGGDG